MITGEFFSYYRFPAARGKWGNIRSETGNHTEDTVLLDAVTKLRDNEWDFEITGGGTAGQPDATIEISADEKVLDVIEQGLKIAQCTKNELLDNTASPALGSGEKP